MRPPLACTAVLFLVSCWAPDIADLPASPTAPPPVPAPQPVAAPEAPAPVHSAPAPQPPPPRQPTAALTATPESELGSPPYTAWTAHAPLTPVGPGGQPVTHIARYGVRIEVLQVLDHRTRFRCDGCMGDDNGKEAWLQTGRLRAAGAPGMPEDPLVAALQLRARWASGADHPAPAPASAWCGLIDAGFVWSDPTHVRFEHGGGRLDLAWTDGRWRVADVVAPGGAGECRTQRAAPR